MPKEFEQNPSNGEVLKSTSYKDKITEMYPDSGIWDYLRYDEEGDLWINNLRIKDAIEHVASTDSSGTPLEITDTTIIERRTKEWEQLTQKVAQKVGYTGGFEYFYAAKANRASEFVHAALRSGWNSETSSKQDLDDLAFMETQGLIDKSQLKIINNGFKLPPDNRWDVIRAEASGDVGTVVFEQFERNEPERIDTYAETIIAMRKKGFQIAPILDSGEVDYFLKNAPDMEVGLRLKFGKVSTEEELHKLTSRFGMKWDELRQTADKIDASDNLKLTMLHTMVGAAETIKEEEFAQHLSLALDKYYTLKATHASLTHLNIGGGIPPMSEKYNHEKFLEAFLREAKRKAEVSGQPEPVITFELGSYVAAEAGFYVFDVIQEKDNSIDKDGKQIDWMLLDGSLIEAIPDMLLIQKSFNILAVNNANAQAKEVILGDLTCDSDGRYPPKAQEEQKVLIPEVGIKNYVVITGVGAYQEQLAGVRGGHHCGLLEAAEVIVEKRNDGQTYARVMPRQTLVESQDIFGYTPEYIDALKKTVK